MSFASYSALLGGDWGVYQTVRTLKTLILQALTDPNARIRRRAEALLAPTYEKDEVGETGQIFNFVQNALHYVDDPLDIELVKTPILIDQEVESQGYFMGDCDDASGYLAALLKSVGYPVELVIVTPAGSDSNDYRHIYVRAWLSQAGEWVALDPTAKGKGYGWEVVNQKERAYVV